MFHYNDISFQSNIYINDIENVVVPEELKGDGQCDITVPVIIINYFPTNDGIYQDEKRGPTDWSEYYNPTLDHMKYVLMKNILLTKLSIEEGSRFRDFGSNTVSKYVCVDVIKYINLYSLPLKKWGVPDSRENTIDYKELFPKLGVEDLVNNSGVKEIWLGAFQNFGSNVISNDDSVDKNFIWGIPESNMSSPLTGDISNSWARQDDLPVYNNTYITYCLLADDAAIANMHMRGHQIEVMLKYLDKTPEKMYENLFEGRNNSTHVYNGRVGNIHYPPNAARDYDYYSDFVVSSDIFSWKPSGGDKTDFNSNTYLDIEYKNLDFVVPTARSFKYGSSGDRDLTRTDLKWYLLWNQSIPGKNNNIDYELNGVNYKLNNWWDLIYNWDEAITENKTLWE